MLAQTLHLALQLAIGLEESLLRHVAQALGVALHLTGHLSEASAHIAQLPVPLQLQLIAHPIHLGGEVSVDLMDPLSDPVHPLDHHIDLPGHLLVGASLLPRLRLLLRLGLGLAGPGDERRQPDRRDECDSGTHLDLPSISDIRCVFRLKRACLDQAMTPFPDLEFLWHVIRQDRLRGPDAKGCGRRCTRR
jgi:hypothetical protein